MSGVWHAWGGVILATLAAAPLVALVAWVLVRLRPDRPAGTRSLRC